MKQSSLDVSFEWPSHGQPPYQATYLGSVHFNTDGEDGRYKHGTSYSALNEQRGEETHLRQRFGSESFALISITVPSGAFPVTFLLVLTAALSSWPLRKKLFYLPVNSPIKKLLLTSLLQILRHF